MRRRLSWLVIAALLSLGHAAAAQVPSSDQQKCLTTLAKGTLKLSKTQAKENRSCVKGAGKGTLPSSAEVCVVADAKGKLAKTAAKNTAADQAKCSDVAAPDFGSGGATAANDAAMLAEVDLARDVLGDPLDTGLASCDLDKASCSCQAKALGSVDKFFATLGKTHAGCKKKRFKEGSIATAGDLEGCLDDAGSPLSIAADTKGKLLKSREKLAKLLAKSCDAAGVATTALPGSCDGMAGAALAGCLADRAECRFCQMVNAADDTFADCDGFDDATANGSCENLSCPSGENACITGCTNLDTDEANCGICGMACGGGETCTSGLCI